MLKIAKIYATILFGLISFFSCGESKAERLYETPIEPLRLDSNRLYLWIDTDHIPTSDFTLELTKGDRLLYSGLVGGVLDRVVVSRYLPDSVMTSIRETSDYVAQVFLESELITDSLVIAVPGNLRQLWLDTMFTSNSEMPIRYLFRYYDDMREVDIAARLGQIDILLLPDMGIPGYKKLSDSPFILEWNLISGGIKDDLLATALNYCLRGLFAEVDDNAFSWFISSFHIESIFPRNSSHARELFAQSKKGKDKISISFPGLKMYPQLFDRINMAFSECGFEKFMFRDDRSQALTLQIFAFRADEDPNTVLARAWREVLLPQQELLSSANGAEIDSCLMGVSVSVDCREQISRRLAESARFVPLGRTQLTVGKFEHVRYLDDRSSNFKLSNFYTIKR